MLLLCVVILGALLATAAPPSRKRPVHPSAFTDISSAFSEIERPAPSYQETLQPNWHGSSSHEQRVRATVHPTVHASPFRQVYHPQPVPHYHGHDHEGNIPRSGTMYWPPPSLGVPAFSPYPIRPQVSHPYLRSPSYYQHFPSTHLAPMISNQSLQQLQQPLIQPHHHVLANFELPFCALAFPALYQLPDFGQTYPYNAPSSAPITPLGLRTEEPDFHYPSLMTTITDQNPEMPSSSHLQHDKSSAAAPEEEGNSSPRSAQQDHWDIDDVVRSEEWDSRADEGERGRTKSDATSTRISGEEKGFENSQARKELGKESRKRKAILIDDEEQPGKKKGKEKDKEEEQPRDASEPLVGGSSPPRSAGDMPAPLPADFFLERKRGSRGEPDLSSDMAIVRQICQGRSDYLKNNDKFVRSQEGLPNREEQKMLVDEWNLAHPDEPKVYRIPRSEEEYEEQRREAMSLLKFAEELERSPTHPGAVTVACGHLLRKRQRALQRKQGKAPMTSEQRETSQYFHCKSRDKMLPLYNEATRLEYVLYKHMPQQILRPLLIEGARYTHQRGLMLLDLSLRVLLDASFPFKEEDREILRDLLSSTLTRRHSRLMAKSETMKKQRIREKQERINEWLQASK